MITHVVWETRPVLIVSENLATGYYLQKCMYEVLGHHCLLGDGDSIHHTNIIINTWVRPEL